MSNRKLNPHIHFIETKNALHTWVIIAGWSFDGRAGIDLNGDSNILIISYMIRMNCHPGSMSLPIM